jgi:integrase
VSVTKRVYEYTGKDGKTKTYTVWRARVWTYPPHGPRRQIEEEFDGKTEAEKWERKQRDTAHGRNVDFERLTLAESGLWARAEPVLRSRLAPKTFDHYRRGWNKRVLDTLGGVKLGALSVGDVERAQATWAAAGAKPSTVRQARLALSAVLTVAVSDGLIATNVARMARRPSGDKMARRDRHVGQTMTTDQLDGLVTRIREMRDADRYALMVELMGYAGLRYGEAAGLYVGDLDFNRGLIEVQRQVTEVSKDQNERLSSEYRRVGNLLWGPPKGEKSRIVPMPRHMVDVLRAHTAGRSRGDLVFWSERGDKVIRGNVLKRRVSWSKLVARHGFAGFRVHDLRATAATNYLAAGVPVNVVRDILGHEDIKVTNLYARSHDDALTRAAAAMDRYSGR